MKLETFFEKFDQFADAPDAVAKMRELVLRLATTGRITHQDSSDQPGSQLLEEIFSVRDSLIKRGVAKNRIEGRPTTAGDTTDLPSSWSRCMISEVCDLQTGATPSRTVHRYFGGDVPWLVSGDINKVDITECEGRITAEGLENSNCKIIPANSVLIALNGQGKTRATVAVLRLPAALNQSLVAMIPYSRERLLPEYIFWNLRGRYHAIRDITGQDQRRGLNMKLVGQLTIPIPPIAEQKRIVAKVDELMTLCDRLEAQQKERATRHAVLARASLARFADAPTPANLEFIFHKSYDVTLAEIRTAILTLAIQGNLRTGENDSRIRWGPAARGDHRWPTRTLGSIAKLITKGSTPTSYGHQYQATGIPFVKVENIAKGNINRSSIEQFISDTTNEFLKRSQLEAGDILFSIAGTIGKTCVVQHEDVPANTNQALAIIRGFSTDFDLNFLKMQLDSFVANKVKDKARGGAMPNVSLGDIRNLQVAVPPLDEQRRIVAKVDQLMALVDELEKQLSASRATAEKLLEALVAELTAPEKQADSFRERALAS